MWEKVKFSHAVNGPVVWRMVLATTCTVEEVHFCALAWTVAVSHTLMRTTWAPCAVMFTVSVTLNKHEECRGTASRSFYRSQEMFSNISEADFMINKLVTRYALQLTVTALSHSSASQWDLIRRKIHFRIPAQENFESAWWNCAIHQRHCI